jgi:hypothetical protein
MKLDAGTFLLQWATGGLFFLWVTTRRREVGLGYSWLLRGIYGAYAAIATILLAGNDHQAAAVLATLVAVTAWYGIVVSIRRRREGPGAVGGPLDLLAPAFGTVGLLVAAGFAGGGYGLAALRLLVGAAFLGCVTDAMLLGHWYLVQPGLRRAALEQLVNIMLVLWPIEVAVLLLPTGMVSVINGTIDDGYNGLLGWVWIACAVATIALVYVTRLALRERYYSAVMSATGLLYLAILTAFGTDLIARAILS